MQEAASTTYDLFEILPSMRNELLIASRQILAVGFGQFEGYRGDMVTLILIGHHETMTGKKRYRSTNLDACGKVSSRCERFKLSVIQWLWEDLNAKTAH